MKKLLILLATFLLMISYSHAEVVKPSININDIANWETVKEHGPDRHGYSFETKKNPDLTHIVKYVVTSSLNSQIVGFGYYEGNRLFVWERSGAVFISRIAPLVQQQRDFIYYMLHPIEPNSEA